MLKMRLKDNELIALIDQKTDQLNDLYKEQKVLLEELDLLTKEMFNRGIDRVAR